MVKAFTALVDGDVTKEVTVPEALALLQAAATQRRKAPAFACLYCGERVSPHDDPGKLHMEHEFRNPDCILSTVSVPRSPRRRFPDQGWSAAFEQVAAHPRLRTGNAGKYVQLYGQPTNEALLYGPKWSVYPVHLKDIDSLSSQAFVDSARDILELAPPKVDGRGFLRYRVLNWEAFAAVVHALADGIQPVQDADSPSADGQLGLEACVLRMVGTTFATAARSGRKVIATTTVKNKFVLLSREELAAHIRALLANGLQRCSLTGIPLDIEQHADRKDYWPSLDRIDSSGHYGLENLQVVCRFVNYWKSSHRNDDFKALLAQVRRHTATRAAMA